MIEIYLLEQLLAFQKYGTLSETSEALHISQPALSRSMQKLELLVGVPLFERQKNKINLNENGILLAKYAEKIWNLEDEMLSHVRAFDQNNRTIVLGSCALTPARRLSSILSNTFPTKEVSFKIEDERTLLHKLEKDVYSLIVLTHPIDNLNYHSQIWASEDLYATLPPSHPLANREAIHINEVNAENVLFYTHVGFWQEMLRSKLPNTHFVFLDEYDIVNHLIRSVDWPYFQTNFTIPERPELADRVNIPLLDSEAHVTYYCICKKKHYKKLNSFFNTL